MKKIVNLFCTFALLFVPLIAHAGKNVYYVTQKGAGARNGSSLSNAWSVSDFNRATNWSATDRSNKIDPGDTVYFSGTITTLVDPQGSGSPGSVITLDGYKGGSCNPIKDNCSSGAKMSRALVRGNRDYLTIQDMNISGGKILFRINDIGVSGTADHITLRNCYIHDAGNALMHIGVDKNKQGSNYITIENNKFIRYGKASGSNPPQGINFHGVEDLIIRKNVMAGTGCSSCTSDNVIEFHNCDRVLMEYNDVYGAKRQAGFAIKEAGPGNHDFIVRFNKIHDNNNSVEGRSGFVGWYASYNIYIYGNFFYGNGRYGIDMSDGIDDVWYWANIFANNGGSGLGIWDRGFGYHSDNINFINNTFYRNAINNTGYGYPFSTGLYIADDGTTNAVIKNNIFCYNRPNATTHNQIGIVGSVVGDGELEHNTYYFNGAKEPTIYYAGSTRTLATLKSKYKVEDNSPAGEVANPGFTDPNGADNKHGTADDNFTLNGKNINDGADLSKCWYIKVQNTTHKICLDDALDPVKTNWKQTPPVVYTAKQDSYGRGWERGAYIYTGSQSISKEPEETLSAPTGLRPVD